jgi:short-subunit dehydrogenase
MRWRESVVVVTGGSRGIGRAIAERAVVRGAKVGLIARDKPALEAALDALGGSRVGAVASADVADRAQLEAALADLAGVLGPVDILVNNAGLGAAGPVTAVPVEAIERVMAINYLGTVYATKALLPGMVERGRGHIVNVASVAGRFAAPGEAAYSATKFAVVGFSQALALELHGTGVGLSLIDPGPVDTGFFEARGADYQRSWPRKVPVARVADAVIEAVERGQLEVFVPRWYRAVGILQAGLSGMFRLLPPGLFGITPSEADVAEALAGAAALREQRGGP